MFLKVLFVYLSKILFKKSKNMCQFHVPVIIAIAPHGQIYLQVAEIVFVLRRYRLKTAYVRVETYINSLFLAWPSNMKSYWYEVC